MSASGEQSPSRRWNVWRWIDAGAAIITVTCVTIAVGATGWLFYRSTVTDGERAAAGQDGSELASLSTAAGPSADAVAPIARLDPSHLDPPRETRQRAAEIIGFRVVQDVQMRRLPTVRSAVIALLRANARIERITESGGWMLVRTLAQGNGDVQEGWVDSRFVNRVP